MYTYQKASVPEERLGNVCPLEYNELEYAALSLLPQYTSIEYVYYNICIVP